MRAVAVAEKAKRERISLLVARLIAYPIDGVLLSCERHRVRFTRVQFDRRGQSVNDSFLHAIETIFGYTSVNFSRQNSTRTVPSCPP